MATPYASRKALIRPPEMPVTSSRNGTMEVSAANSSAHSPSTASTRGANAYLAWLPAPAPARTVRRFSLIVAAVRSGPPMATPSA